jgi:UDP-N-acetylmuramoyl-tripeptide--D-alanyl-D-alanine ligase
MLELGGVTVINDCYNSNPASLTAALQLLDAVRGGRPAVVVVGTMRELGAASEQLHEEAARAVIAARPDLVAAVGDFAPVFRRLEKRLGKGKLIVGEDAPAVAEPLKERLKPGDVLLLKASRGVALERLFPLLWPDHPTTSPHP